MTQLSRRSLLAASLASPFAGGVSGLATAQSASVPPAPAGPDDEAYWARVAANYDVTGDITNVENGNWGLMAHPVLDAYKAHTERVNRDNSYFARRAYGPIFMDILEETATRLGASTDEIAFTRGATEALQNLIAGYNRLEPGDAVMMADLDYGSVMNTMRWKASQAGAETIEIAIPEPATHDAVLETYRAALTSHPNTRLLLLTHISHRTGLVMPVREISEMAHEQGVDVVVDAAHSWGQMDFTAPDLGADFIGFNLHKWIGAPIGVGAMYIRKGRLGDIDPNMSAGPGEVDSIHGRVHTGTSNFAAYMSVPDAFAFQDTMGWPEKAARLSHLRDLWVSQCQGVEGVEVLTPDDPRMHAGITSFRFSGMASEDENKAIAAYLLEHHQVFTVHRTGVTAGACIRVTPGYYNSARDMQRAAAAILDARQHFLG
ncbi:aminotransferase class V-fold PLP-dependent enzyme [Henriciella aquimarina]|uniref:aminotransferase class V-fold PLP-dependent enzyme n=1 Tax=Henriciella aquimarina TaxID=545261 RepID=UPI0009FE6D44|nr:aminotransferase class V-fold PLP-dependent enzyme [Henriciella aquimarina]